MPAQRRCVRCRETLPPDAPPGICPRCEFEGALSEGLLGASRENEEALFAPLTIKRGSYFGDYELLEEVGRGGMGIVYRARQLKLDRIVALKVILAGHFANKQFIQRFRGEAAAAGMLQHANIVSVHEVGMHGGMHFFSMDFVEGQSLAQLAGHRPFSAAQAARYVTIIATAIHYAHGQGILHRDLKPSNVLVESSTDQPRVTDFGLAKRLDSESLLTVTGEMLGSPAFMPPEQIRGDRAKVGRQSDIYGLGAILYFLLTGRAPFQGDSVESVLAQVLEAEPVSPRLLNQKVPLDLQTICLKCLDKEPARRYAIAAHLAADLEHFLQGEPIQARPIAAPERMWRWCRRKPVLAGLAMTTLVLLLAFGLGAPIALYRISQEKALAQAEAAARRQQLYAAEVNLAGRALEDGDFNRARALLTKQMPGRGETNDLRGFEWRYLTEKSRGAQFATLPGRADRLVQSVRFSPVGNLLAGQEEFGVVLLWDYPSRQLLTVLGQERTNSYSRPEDASPLAFSPDGRLLAVGSGTTILVWDVNLRSVAFSVAGLATQLNYLEFSPDGKLLASAGDDETLTLWKLKDGVIERFASLSTGFQRPFRVVFSPDGKTLAAAGEDTAVARWDISDLNNISTLPSLEAHTGWIAALAFSPTAQMLYSAGAGGDVIEWASPKSAGLSWRKLPPPHRSIGIVLALAVTPNGERLISGGNDANITIWDLTGRESHLQLAGHTAAILSLAVSPDGKTIASSARDNTVKLWDLAEARKAHIPPRMSHGRAGMGVAFSPDSKLIASVTGSRKLDNSGGGIKIWSIPSQDLVAHRELPNSEFPRILFSQDGQYLASSEGNQIRLRKVPSLNEVASLPGYCPVFSPEGSNLVYFGRSRDGRGIRWRDLATQREQVWESDWSPVQVLAVSRNGRVAAGVGTAVKLREPSSPRRDVLLGQHSDRVSGLAFSPDGDLLASAGWDGSVRLWNLNQPKRISPPLIAHKGFVWSVAFSPDGRTLATGGDDSAIRLWNVATLQEAAVLRGHAAHVTGLAFSPDGQRLASTSGDGTVRVWWAPPFQGSAKPNELNEHPLP